MSGTERLPLFPLHAVLFPGGTLGLRVFEPRYLDMASRMLRGQGTFGICLIAAGQEAGEAAVPHLVGTEARIEHWENHASGVLSVVVRGERRFRITDHELELDGLLVGEVAWLAEPAVQPVPEAQADILPLLREMLQREKEKGWMPPPHRFDDAAWVGARYAELLPIPLLARQRLLELDDIVSRLEIVQQYLRQHGLLSPRAFPSPSVEFPMSSLFDPLQLGEFTLPNRIIMAPLTRCRASAGRVPNALMAEYYAQRASAGLILSEASSVTPQGVGYPDSPGIWNGEQIAAWKLVVEAVHKAGGRIFMQLWHVGRISDPVYLNGDLPVAPSAIAAEGHVSLLRPQRAYVTPRALETAEIPAIVAAYRQGAANAKAAGFDGVEIHAANGYLIDQFLQDGVNRRTDAYGGPIENRARLLLEVTDAAIDVWGPGRVGVHLAPRCDSHSMGDSDPASTFGYVATELGKRRIAFIFAREAQGPGLLGPQLKQQFGGVFIVNQGLTGEAAVQLLSTYADAAAFGVPFIANPDLVERLRRNAPLNAPRPELFYGGGGAEGYTDYPFLD